MNEIDKNEYIKRYNGRLEMYGHDIKTLGWGGDKNRQYLRFKVAMELANFCSSKDEILSVLDIGCGFGDMGGEFLKNNYPNIKYVGIDINQKLIDAGRKKYPKLDLRCIDVLEVDINEKFDIVCESGIFNYQLNNENQLEYIEKMLTKMYLISNYGICADFLSTFVDFQHEGAFHTNELDAIKLSKKLSKRIILRNDYLDYEYALYILKVTNDK